MMSLPIKTKPKRKVKPLAIRIYNCVFRWMDKKFINLQTQEEQISQIWGFVGLVPLNSIFENGRKFRDIRGKISLKKKVYGYKAVAEALTDSRGLPINEGEVRALIKDAIAKQISHGKFVLESDLVPCSPDQFEGENKWLFVADYPNSDVMGQKINAQLKALGSPLRIQSKMRTKVVEV
jgi:hypothetical protein